MSDEVATTEWFLHLPMCALIPAPMLLALDAPVVTYDLFDPLEVFQHRYTLVFTAARPAALRHCLCRNTRHTCVANALIRGTGCGDPYRLPHKVLPPPPVVPTAQATLVGSGG